jgi:magnesium transporter
MSVHSVEEKNERPGLLNDVDAELVENITPLIRDGQQGMILNMVADLYPVDLARLLCHLPFDESYTLFKWLPDHNAGEILPELDDDYRARLLEEMSPADISTMLEDLDTDDVADVLADLPDDLVEGVLPHLEDEEDVRELLNYDEETAGGLMEAEYVAVSEHMTVHEATEAVRRNAEVVDPVFAVFAVDEEGRLKGIVPMKDLLLSREHVPISTIMDTEIISVTPDLDQEEVARIMERYDLYVMPVVDENGYLRGRITIDDVVDVIREEAEEDIQRMSGTSDEEITSSIFKISRGRLVWLCVGLLGALLSGAVILTFEEEVKQVVALATFIPVVMAMAGNAGIQSSSIAVQGLASGEVWASDMGKRIGKELVVAVLNGVAIAVFSALVVFLVGRTGLVDFDGSDALLLALTVGFSLFVVILLATTIGATIPLLLDRFKIDPALATGPFITTSNDILGLVVYFTVASWMLQM